MLYTEYETIYVVRPELTEDTVRALNEKVDGIVGRFEGHILFREDWGKRKLAYPIQKNSKGHYIYLRYLGPTEMIAEIERNLRIDSNLLRFLTVRLGYDVELEERLAEGERIRAEQATRAALAAENEDDDQDENEDDSDSDSSSDADSD